jgi:hypothetical protein
MIVRYRVIRHPEKADMKRYLSTTLVTLFAAGALAISAAAADAHGHFRGRVGVFIGAPIVASPWAYPYYGYGYPYYGPAYYPPVVEQPSVYVEQAPSAVAPAAPPPASAPQAQAQQQYWYFCQDTKTYYPHVQTCASPWQRVMPHAPQ